MYSHLYSVCTPRTSRCTPHMTCTLYVLYVLHVVLRKYTQSTDRVHCTLHGPWEYIQSTWRILKYRVHNRVHNTVHQEYIPKYRTPYPDESTFTVHQEYTPEYGTATPPSPCPNPPQSTHRVRSRVRTEYSRNAVMQVRPSSTPPMSYPRWLVVSVIYIQIRKFQRSRQSTTGVHSEYGWSTCTPETQQSTPKYIGVHSPSAEYIEYNRIHLKYVEYATM